MKYQIEIEERRRYSHSMIIEIGEDVSESKLNSIMSEAEKRARDMGWDYIENVFEHKGINVIEVVEDSSGDDGDVEIIEVYEV